MHVYSLVAQDQLSCQHQIVDDHQRTVVIVLSHSTKLLRIDEVSTLTGVPESTLRYWRFCGSGPRSAKLGRRVVYREADVLEWIDAQFEQAG
ncbi:helix-turn-helix transcriptional regulator [Nocardioides bruguierae]|uniref:Helix-turn-helix domain-containing protein n=1 Tax=Nocardioides bruguierae TaxID=2945102 RepID=A0A9X2ICZ8_9ACTN|nr:helix-turn-helix domain-containing protein [Nocardioides bruguierae]MCM0618742.1 helix-turn-helix domain-containing protein [Nocardioides bruguierae]